MKLATLQFFFSLSGIVNMQYSEEATCRIQTYLFLAGFCWPVHEEVLKQRCSENHYRDTNPQLKHGSLRSSIECTVLQNTPLPLTREFSFRNTAAHQLFFPKRKKRQGGWEEGRGKESLCIMMPFSSELQTESTEDKYFKCDRFQLEMWKHFPPLISCQSWLGQKLGCSYRLKQQCWK